MPLPTDATVPPDDVRAGRFYLAYDHQVLVGEGPTAHYYRQAWKVLSTAGVQEASEISIEFDPAFQRLVLHDVLLWRDGRNVRAFKASDVNVIHKENDLSERIYNGSLTALVFLKDVRPGDIVDYAYTVVGTNPLLDGRFVGRFDLAYGIPVARLRHRLLWPKDRLLTVRKLRTEAEPVLDQAAGMRIHTWELRNVAAVRMDDATPSWFDPYPELQLSEFSSWNQVAHWANRLFQGQNQPSPRLASLLKEWKVVPEEEERARKAIRFVQDDVRYLGIEMGPSSHRPHPPAQVLEQRFGDCKDKALLLVALLNGLGIEASPALVNTDARRALDGWQPTPFAFDHAIVLARIAGAPVWIDATRSETGGRPTTFEPPPFERALVVRDDTVGLTVIPSPERPAPTTLVEERYTVKPNGAPAGLIVKTTYRGADADRKRQALARASAADVAERHLNHYTEDDPGARAVSPPRFHDDRDNNVIVGEESYELPGFWKDGRHHFYAWAVGDLLHKPRKTVRSMPLFVSHPIHVEQKLTVSLPGSADVKAGAQEIRSAAFAVKARSEASQRTITLTYSYHSLSDSLAAEETRRHVDAVDRAENAIGYWINFDEGPVIARDAPGDRAAGWIGLGLLTLTAVGLGTMALRAGRARVRARAFRRSAVLPEGESPATARRLAGWAQLPAALERRACACGARGQLREVERHTFTYDEKPMSVVTGRCDGCGREQAVYVLVAEP